MSHDIDNEDCHFQWNWRGEGENKCTCQTVNVKAIDRLAEWDRKMLCELIDAQKKDGNTFRTENARLRAGIIKARDALDNYDYDTSLFDIMNGLDELLGDTDV